MYKIVWGEDPHLFVSGGIIMINVTLESFKTDEIRWKIRILLDKKLKTIIENKKGSSAKGTITVVKLPMISMDGNVDYEFLPWLEQRAIEIMKYYGIGNPGCTCKGAGTGMPVMILIFKNN